jgi:hypothetical protein
VLASAVSNSAFERGADVKGGLFTKPIDFAATLKKAGWTAKDFRRPRLMASSSWRPQHSHG